MRRRLVIAVFGAATLTGCASVNPIQQDQPLMLAAGDGIAAVQFDTLDHITQVQIVSVLSSGETMNIPSVPIGQSTYLFEVPAGRYCLQRFYVGDVLIYHQGQYVSCFVVPAGDVGFSGIYSPRGDNGRIVTDQNMDIANARAELERDYPHIAAQFLRPEPAPAEAVAPTPGPLLAGNQQTSAWIVHEKHPLADIIYMRNNTKWPLEITTFELYDCANIKQICTTMHPEFKLAPHQTRRFMQIEPGDPLGAYAFHYQFYYGFQ
ncbi:MAG: hypothetical protein WBR29_13090 [Gammaproteobacteria bacterium]